MTTSGHTTTVNSKSVTASSKPAGTHATTITSAKPPNTSVPGEAALTSCCQLYFNNMLLAQFSALRCNALDAYCLCNINFSNGLRDCSDGACATAVASTVIAFGSAYCSTAFAPPTPTTTSVSSHPPVARPASTTCWLRTCTLVARTPIPATFARMSTLDIGRGTAQMEHVARLLFRQ